MLTCEHLDDQAPNAPYIGLLRVCDLFDNLWGHPIDRALKRGTVQAISWQEIFLKRLKPRTPMKGDHVTHCLPTF